MTTKAKSLTVKIDALAALKAKVTLTQSAMLILLHKGMNTVEVRKILGTDRTMMSVNIGKLRDRGLIETDIDKKDRRFIEVELTPEGIEILDIIRG